VYYYLGEERLWKGDRFGAEEFFRKSVATNAYSFVEYRSSKAMLRKMAEGKI
jgi:lipoprotein NlpI